MVFDNTVRSDHENRFVDHLWMGWVLHSFCIREVSLPRAPKDARIIGSRFRDFISWKFVQSLRVKKEFLLDEVKEWKV